METHEVISHSFSALALTINFISKFGRMCLILICSPFEVSSVPETLSKCTDFIYLIHSSLLAYCSVLSVHDLSVSPSITLDSWFFPNGNTTSNQRRFHVDITSIHRRPSFLEFPRRFGVFFWRNFDSRKINVFYSTLLPLAICCVISMVEKYTFFPCTFFDVISIVEKST